MQKQLLKMREELKQQEAELQKNIDDKQQLKNQIQNLKAGLKNPETTHTLQDAAAASVVSCSQEEERVPEKNWLSLAHSERNAMLVRIISAFPHVHPLGASAEYICSYLQRLDAKINPGEVEALFSRLPCTFRQELTGVEASLEKRWTFCGFQEIRSM
ncbi:hypothetical protein LDENG_00176760 [Lucifuga dentata]|nr:hypothetical protein LDENG_00176760 [Lucifuga dentata]